MSTLVQIMLRDALDAHVTRDLDLANDIRVRDEEVDQMHNTLFRELLTYMMEDPRNITAVHASAVRGQERRAGGRSRHRYL